MPNLSSILKGEITRLARKEVRAELESLKKASAKYRSDIAELKRILADLQKQLGRVAKGKAVKAEAAGEANSKVRFSPKGLATKRQKLGLSAADMGKLLGVSAQTVYHWEAGKTRPRASQLPAIANLRRMGKRQVKAALETGTPE
jgi:DNA-binding transcriptional regulator YiaG